MTIESIQYWDVFPKLIRVSQSGFTQYIPLSIRGDIASPVFESSNPDITNRNANPSYGLAQSGANVKVFLNDNQEITFNVPNAAGTIWTVFEIEGATGRLIPVNAMSHVSEPNNVGL